MSLDTIAGIKSMSPEPSLLDVMPRDLCERFRRMVLDTFYASPSTVRQALEVRDDLDLWADYYDHVPEDSRANDNQVLPIEYPWLYLTTLRRLKGIEHVSSITEADTLRIRHHIRQVNEERDQYITMHLARGTYPDFWGHPFSISAEAISRFFRSYGIDNTGSIWQLAGGDQKKVEQYLSNHMQEVRAKAMP